MPCGPCPQQAFNDWKPLLSLGFVLCVGSFLRCFASSEKTGQVSSK